jgi:hypothetical protein
MRAKIFHFDISVSITMGRKNKLLIICRWGSRGVQAVCLICQNILKLTMRLLKFMEKIFEIDRDKCMHPVTIMTLFHMLFEQ